MEYTVRLRYRLCVEMAHYYNTTVVHTCSSTHHLISAAFLFSARRPDVEDKIWPIVRRNPSKWQCGVRKKRTEPAHVQSAGSTLDSSTSKHKNNMHSLVPIPIARTG